MIDRVAARPRAGALVEVPVGFKWFVPGLLDGVGRLRRRGERGCVVPAPRRHGVDHRQGRDHPAACSPRRSWRVTGQTPSRALRASWPQRFGDPAYARIDVARRPRRRRRCSRKLSPEQVTATELAGEPITAQLTAAPGNGAAIGGLKVITEPAGSPRARRAPRTSTRSTPSRFHGPEHLAEVQEEAREVVAAALATADPPLVDGGSACRSARVAAWRVRRGYRPWCR